AGYAVELAEGAKRAREVIEGDPVALAVLAPNGVGEVGPDLVRDLDRTVGRLLVVADGADDDTARWSGTALGAAPRVAKPLNQQAFLEQVEAALGPLAEEEPEPTETLRFEGYTLSDDTLRDAGGKKVPLTRSELALLWALVRQLGETLSRDELRQA